MFEAIRSAIETHDPIIIHRHSSPDGDALGSQVKGILVGEVNILGQMRDDVVLAIGNRCPVEVYGEFANVPSEDIILERVRAMLAK